MKKTDKIIIFLCLSIPVLFVGCFFLWGVFFSPNRQELFVEQSRNLVFNGKIESIYNDKKNHNSRTVMLTNGYKYDLYDYWKPYFEVGDSVSKAKGSLKLFIYKKNKEMITLDYGTLKEMFMK